MFSNGLYKGSQIWHSRGRRFDPDYLHQITKARLMTLLFLSVE
nr:MAG TPA: hypothetical protein [Caudoviricetes sp.]